jgi:hypothetical protein
MKERFAVARRVYPDDPRQPEGRIALGRWYRRAGRLCLLGAAFSAGVEILMVEQDKLLPPVTLHSLFGLSPDITVPGLALLKAAIVDSPLWVVLLVAAAIPYALAVQQFIKEKPRR